MKKTFVRITTLFSVIILISLAIYSIHEHFKGLAYDNAINDLAAIIVNFENPMSFNGHRTIANESEPNNMDFNKHFVISIKNNQIQLLKDGKLLDRLDLYEYADESSTIYWSKDSKYVAVNYWMGTVDTLVKIYSVENDKLKDIFTFDNKYVYDNKEIKLSASDYLDNSYIEGVKWENHKIIIGSRYQLSSNAGNSNNRVFLETTKTHLIDPMLNNIELVDIARHAYIATDKSNCEVKNPATKTEIIPKIKEEDAEFKDDAEFSKCFNDAKKFLKIRN